MRYSAIEIGKILNVSDLANLKDFTIEEISIDTRSIISPIRTLFFALPGKMRDGHQFIENAHSKGVRNFVVLKESLKNENSHSNYFVVEDVLEALQKLATWHQQSHADLKKIAITGSNGKTIIKEWLYQMLFDNYHIVKSPKSYNSQIGMALSLLEIETGHNLGIFEAGISKSGEMENHLKMLNPDIGIFTNLGSAHDEGFLSRNEKLQEKMVLFQNVETIIYCKQHVLIDDFIQKNYSNKHTVTWGAMKGVDVMIIDHKIVETSRIIVIRYKGTVKTVNLRFSDEASFENCMHCIALMCNLGLALEDIVQRVNRISGLHMRLEMTSGMHQSILINDAYSADLNSLQNALEFVRQQAGKRSKLAILSAFEQSGQNEAIVFKKIIDFLIGYGFSKLIYISDQVFEVSTKEMEVQFFPSKKQLLKEISKIDIHKKVVLIKGARQFELEEISERLSEKSHSALLQINLNALEQNLRIYKSLLKKDVGIISVVKASAYGTGSAEIARVLERNDVAYLAVAFADEGIALRQAGIKAKIMVFNPDLSSLPDIVRYDLEPEIYDFGQLEQIISFTNQNRININIHLKLDTGMHRLGFLMDEVEKVATNLKNAKFVHVNTVFSHLASSEDENDDSYSNMQFDLFDKMYNGVCQILGVAPKRHILNSGGISRFPNNHYNFVRLGIGMYGIDNNPEVSPFLKKVHTLNASLIQIKKIESGQSIGYNRQTILDADTMIGIVNIGYADGLMRNLGNGKFHFKINGKNVKIIGNVCMDLTIIDLSNVPKAKVGDLVTIFDESHPIERLAAAAGTIPYEVLSRISPRVKRKFVRE